MTFVFTDVVNSTALWQQAPEAMRAALVEHERIVRDSSSTHGGYVFSTAGDSFGIGFPDAPGAIAAAVAIQRRLAAHAWTDIALSVRIGMHPGTAEERDGNYFGTPVNRAARIQSLAEAGQILISQATRILTGSDLPEGVTTTPLGLQRLKSFDEPEELFQLAGDGLSSEVTLSSTATHSNLPTPMTKFVGRADDIDALGRLISPGIMVTVSGIGGLGKTRIAIEAANTAGRDFPDGVWWIDLAPLSTDAALAEHVAASLQLTVQPSMDAADSIADGLRRQTSLIVLDNCEHVVDGVAPIVDRIRRDCPQICVVATSQVPLGIAGEAVLSLGALDTSSDAVALLVARAEANDAAFDPQRWPRQDLEDLCARLDGLPLAIEMAAARLRVLSPRDIIDRLDDRFRILKSTVRGTTERHQSLLAALDWSYELLDPHERLLLDRLSVFAGTFDLAAASGVCSDDELDEFDILDLLAALLEKSLISQVDGGFAMRYRLLDSVRHYCASHLDEPAQASLQRSLVDYFVTVADTNNLKWLGDTREDFDIARRAFVDEWDNFRTAVAWAVELDDAASCDAIFQALWAFSFETFRNEIGGWGRDALRLTTPPTVVYGICAMTSQSTPESIELLNTAVETIDESTPDPGACFCYSVLSFTYQARGDALGIEYAQRGRFHAEAIGPSEIAFYDANLAGLLSDETGAETYAASAMAYIRRASSPMRATCIPPLAWFEAKRGRPEVGYDLCMEGVEMCRDAGIHWAPTMALAYRARISLRFGVGDPVASLREAVETGRETRAWFAVWLALAESIPWLREHNYRDAAETIEGYMEAKGMWHRRSATPTGAGSVTRFPGIRRDDLIDFVLAELS